MSNLSEGCQVDYVYEYWKIEVINEYENMRVQIHMKQDETKKYTFWHVCKHACVYVYTHNLCQWKFVIQKTKSTETK